MRVLGPLTAVICFSSAAMALESSPVPILRGGSGVNAAPATIPAPPIRAFVATRSSKPFPLLRATPATPEVTPKPQRLGAAAAPTSDDLAVNTPGVAEASLRVRSLIPDLRPPVIVQQAMARKRVREAGDLAGVRGVRGDTVGRVSGAGACGIEQAYRVSHVSGIPLSTGALMDAGTVRALKAWVDKGLVPSIGSMGGGVAQIRVVAHYACRTRNNQPGARLSEHAKGRAIDIAGFTLQNGQTISLLQDWGSGQEGRALRRMHSQACGIFGTVLGPEANRFHRDHFHFDTARYRSGSYCR